MAFDLVSSNIIYNPKKGTLTAMDFIDNDNYEELYVHSPIKDVFLALKSNLMDN